MIDVEAERVRFEAEIMSDWLYPCAPERWVNGTYKDTYLAGAFRGWLAAKRDAAMQDHPNPPCAEYLASPDCTMFRHMLRLGDDPAREVDPAEWMRAEYDAGFRSCARGYPATAAWRAGDVSGMKILRRDAERHIQPNPAQD